MGLNLDVPKRDKYKYGVEMPRRTPKARQLKIGHDVDSGFPHYSSRNGLCMCLDTCCHREGGCICKTCNCGRNGYEHGQERPHK